MHYSLSIEINFSYLIEFYYSNVTLLEYINDSSRLEYKLLKIEIIFNILIILKILNGRILNHYRIKHLYFGKSDPRNRTRIVRHL